MNWAWFDGKMSIEHYEHEHPLDTLAIARARGSEEDSSPAEAEPTGTTEEVADEVTAPK